MVVNDCKIFCVNLFIPKPFQSTKGELQRWSTNMQKDLGLVEIWWWNSLQSLVSVDISCDSARPIRVSRRGIWYRSWYNIPFFHLRNIPVVSCFLYIHIRNIKKNKNSPILMIYGSAVLWGPRCQATLTDDRTNIFLL